MFRKPMGARPRDVRRPGGWAAAVGRAVWGVALLATAMGTARADDWTTYQHDDQHTGLSSSTVDPTTLTKVWSAPSNYAVPLVVGNTVYAMANQQGVGSATTSISSFNLATGAVNWTDTGKYTFPSQPGYGGGMLAYIGEGPSGGPASLYVLNAATGSQLYTVTLPSNFSGAVDPMPTLATNGSGQLMAYVNDGNHALGITLGSSSGSVAWESAAGAFGGSSIPTVVGNSLIIAGPGQYYAIDQATGAMNHFQNSNLSGGGGTTVTYDASRQEFYVSTAYDGSHLSAITAYSYTDNNHITQLWQYTGPGSHFSPGVAIGPDGGVYSVDSGGNIVELNPATGAVERLVSGLSLGNVTPIIDQNTLIAAGPDTEFFNLSTLTLEKSLPGSIANSGGGIYHSPGALQGNYFLLDNGPTYGSNGFVVYTGQSAVPEPSTLVLAAIAAVGLGLADRLRRRRAR